jgi:predicted adenylyl cyclase CyaB
MPANIEIKAQIQDWPDACRRAEALSGAPAEVIFQEDTFFNVAEGRLKLRAFSQASGQLIFYTRPNQDGPKRSDYNLTATSDPEGLKSVLARAYGIRGVVRKTRLLYLVGQTRIHLDDVEGLGHFLELEVVLRDGQSDAAGREIAEDLMQKLGIELSALLKGAYMDLIESPRRIPE